jgi:hypothetical protein
MSTITVKRCDKCQGTDQPGEKSCGPTTTYTASGSGGLPASLDLCGTCAQSTPCAELPALVKALAKPAPQG